MGTQLVFASAATLQLVAAFLALRLRRVRGASAAWAHIALGLTLMDALWIVSWLWVPETAAAPLPDRMVAAGGSLVVSAVMLVGVLAMQQHFRAAARTEVLHRDLFDGANDAVFVLGPGGAVLHANRSAGAILAHDPAALAARAFCDLVAPSRREEVRERLARLLEEGQGRFETELLGTEGRSVPVELSVRVLRIEDQRIVHVLARDLTSARAAESALGRREAILEAVSFAAERFLGGSVWQEALGDVMQRLGRAADVSRCLVFENRYGPEARLLTSLRHEWTARGVPALSDAGTIADLDVERSPFYEWIARVRSGEALAVHTGALPEGQRRTLEGAGVRSLLAVPVFVDGQWWGAMVFEDRARDRRWAAVEIDAMRAAARVLGAAVQRREVETKLEESRERYGSLVRNAAIGIYRTTPDGRVLMANPAFVRMLGYASFVELASANLEDAYPADHPRADFRRMLEQHGEVRGFETTWRRRDGTVLHVRENARAIRDPEGTVVHYEGTIEDITERRQLESQLRWAAKMEAVGRLAGGIAHDFNNTLTAILGYADRLARRLRGDGAATQEVQGVQEASARAANLVRQLLAVGRRQVHQPKLLRLDELVAGRAEMLRRVLGESVQVAIDSAPDLPRVHADPGQLEQILLNLALNARDAMPQGGSFRIATREVVLDSPFGDREAPVRPGAYVLLSVADTGCGMDDATRSRVFEPFFTTKEEGRGSGLGMASVYGLVKQSGGHIRALSRPGAGTTFEIYLPQAGAATPAPEGPDDGVAEPPEPPHGTETVLVVEDEETIRRMMAETLTESGYRVLTAQDGADAIGVSSAHGGAIDLLVSDVVMPRMGGRELADRLSPERPAMRMLFVSGYSDEVVARQGRLERGSAFLQKPFAPGALARKVRDVLDRIVA